MSVNGDPVAVVSMSWGQQGESTGETSNDTYFQHTGVTYVASSGDSGQGVEWPSISSYVLSVGGTSLTLDSNNNWFSESGWSGSGGGISSQVSQPSYQLGWVTQNSTFRTNPDVAFDADPNTGVAVYDNYDPSNEWGRQWVEVGGTGAGAPSGRP